MGGISVHADCGASGTMLVFGVDSDFQTVQGQRSNQHTRFPGIRLLSAACRPLQGQMSYTG